MTSPLPIPHWRCAFPALLLLATVSANSAGPAEITNSVLALPPLTNTASLTGNMADVGASLGRVLVMLAVVLGLFLGGVWLFRNWQRLTLHRGQAPKLNVIETRSLGGRHALYVVGYENERFLLSTSPAGVNLVSHLPQAEPSSEPPVSTAAPASFAQALAQKLRGGK